MRFMKNPLDVGLLALFGISVSVALLTNEGSPAREDLCPFVCFESAHAQAWNKLLYDLAVGSVVSLLFYALIVRLPEFKRRQRIKRSLATHYRSFKEDCIAVFLVVADRSFLVGAHKELLEQSKFKDYFKQNVSTSQTRWDAFANNLDAHHLQQLITSMQIFRDEIAFVLNNTDIPNDDTFAFFKRLSAAIYSSKDAELDSDSIKSLYRFLWSIFTGWDWVTGYPERDVIQDTIEAI